MSITRAQIARQLLAQGGMPMKEIKGQDHMLAYITPNEADKLVKLGGQETMTPEGILAYPEYDNYGYSNQADFDQGNYSKSNDPTVSGYASGNTQTGGNAQRAAAKAAAAKAKAEKEKQQKITDNAIEQARVNPFAKTFVDRGYVNPSTFDRTKAVSKDYMPPEEEENKFTKALGKTIDIGKNVGKDLITTSLTAPILGPLSFAVGPTVRAAKEDKARRDAIDAQISNARLSGSFYTGPVNPTRTTNTGPPGDGGDGDNNLIPRPFMIQPNRQEVIEEEPTPYDFDLYAARDNRVAKRFAQGGRTGFNMGGMEEENLQAGAPDLRLEGNQVPQQEEMASAPGIDAELYQLFMDALRKGEVPPGTTFDAYKQLMMQMMSEQQGGQMQEEMMQPEMQEGIMQAQMMEPEREMAAFGGIMGSDGRRAYGLGSVFKKAKRAVKKVLKSPIAKAALLAAGAYYAGGGNLFGMQRANMTGFKFGNLPGAGFFKKSEQQIYANSLNKQSNNALKILNNPKNYTAQKIAEAQQIVKDNAPVIQSLTKNTGGMSQGMNLAASIGIPAIMAGVYKQGKADEKPMDANTLARIEGYNNPLFEGGIGGARAKILAGDNTGMNFIGRDDIYAAEGGRIGYANGGGLTKTQIVSLKNLGYDTKGGTILEPFGGLDVLRDILKVNNYAQGGDVSSEGGLMNLGGNEMDLRGGGFVPLGAKEKADDVPARLSKNEFVFTADAVRAAGGGSVDKGAEKMYNTMKRLEGVMV